MSERIRGSYDDALYKSTYTLLSFTSDLKARYDLNCVESAVKHEPTVSKRLNVGSRNQRHTRVPGTL